MARCGCASGQCSCRVEGGTGIEVTGTGTASNPFVVSASGSPTSLTTVDTDTIDMAVIGDGSPSAPYIISATTVADTLQANLLRWYSVVADRNTAVAKTLVIGDSISEGVLTSTPSYLFRWLDVLQKQLRNRLALPAGSAGFMPPYYADGLMSDDTTAAGAAAVEQSWIWGWGGKALLLPGNTGNEGSRTWPSLTCTKIRVWYGKTDFLAGSFKVFVDAVDVTAAGTLWPGGGASGATVSCVNGTKTSGFYWESATLSAGSHVVKVQGSTNGAFGVIEGVEFFNGDHNNGVRVLDGAHSGARAMDYNQSSMAPAWQSVGLLAPQLVIINLGTNDVNSITATQFQSDLQALVNKIRSTVPNVLIMLVKGWRPGSTSQVVWDEFNAAKEAVATLTDNVFTFDLAAQWPVLLTDGSNNQGLMVETTNPVHPNTAGHQRYADILTVLAP